MKIRHHDAATRSGLCSPKALGLAAAGVLLALAPGAMASQAITYTRKGDTVVVRPAHQPHTVTTTRIVRTSDGRIVQREVTREVSREHGVLNRIASDARRDTKAPDRRTPSRHAPTVIVEERPRSIHGGGLTHLKPIYENGRYSGFEHHNAQAPHFGRASGIRQIQTRSTVTPAYNHRITPRSISQTTCTTTQYGSRYGNRHGRHYEGKYTRQHGVFPGTVVRSPVYTRTVHHHHYNHGARHSYRYHRAPSVSLHGTIGGGSSRVGFHVGKSFRHSRSHIGYRHNWHRPSRSGLHIRIGN